MTRILIQRGSGGSSSNPNRSQQLSAPQAAASTSKDEEHDIGLHQEAGGSLGDLLHQCSSSEERSLPSRKEELVAESSQGARHEATTDSNIDNEKCCNEETEDLGPPIRELEPLPEDTESLFAGSPQIVMGPSYPPPPPAPPPKPSGGSFLAPKRATSGGSNAMRTGSSRRQSAWQVLPARDSQSDSRPSSPKSFSEAEGYNSSDEQGTCFGSSYDDLEKERLFEIEVKRVKGLEVRRMLEDGNCLFRAVADQVYGDPEAYDMTRQMCIDYMERERDHYSQFITEGFSSYCKRKRRDKVYGNNMEIQAFSEMYNRPIHIYSYSTEPINIFHGGYNTDTPPIRLSYHHGNHYNSLVDPRRMTIGAGLGFSNLRGANIDKDQVKAAIKAQQDQQIDNALLAEGHFYSDLELTEKEMERMVMEASRAEYLAQNKFKQQHGFRESSTSAAEPSSSGATGSSTMEGARERMVPDTVLSDGIQIVLSMGFSYLQVMEAYSIFGDDVDSMVCYLLEMGGGSCSPGNSREKGKAAE